MKRALICLDPGMTTGMAVLTEPEGYLVSTTNWTPDNLRVSLDALVRHLHSEGYAVEAIVERMPHVGRMSRLERDLEDVRRQIAHVLEETYEIPVTYIIPGEWKPSAAAVTAQLPKFWGDDRLSPHQRDAMRMGCYAITKRGKAA